MRDTVFVNMTDAVREETVQTGMFGIPCNDILNLGNQVIIVNNAEIYCLTAFPEDGKDIDEISFKGEFGGRKVRRRISDNTVAVLDGNDLNTFTVNDAHFVKTTRISGKLAGIVDFECLDPSYDRRIDESNDMLFISSTDIYAKDGDNKKLIIRNEDIGPSVTLSKIQRIEKNTFAIFTNVGIFRYAYQNGDSSDVVYKMTMGSDQICAMCEYVQNEGKMQYLASYGNDVRLTNNLRRWTQLLSVGFQGGEDVEKNDYLFIDGMLALDRNTVVMGSNYGFWMTRYSYQTVNDIPRFTYDDAYEMYSGMQDWIL